MTKEANTDREDISAVFPSIPQREYYIKVMSVKLGVRTDGQNQYYLYNKEDVTLSTIANKSVLVTSIIDTYKGRNISFADILNAFVQREIGKEIIMFMQGKFSKMMQHVFPKLYTSFVTVDWKGTKLLYVCLKKAFYRCMKGTIFF